MNQEPDWDRLEFDVTKRISYLKGAWNCTRANRELHEQMKKDIYLPLVTLLAQFCAQIKECDDEMPVHSTFDSKS